MDLKLIPIIKASPKTELEAIAVSVNRLLAARFKRLSRGAIDAVLSKLSGGGTFTAADATAMIDKLDALLGEAFADAVRKDIAAVIKTAYMTSRARTASMLRIKPEFNLVDKRALEWLSRSYMWWIGDYQSKVLSNEISQFIKIAVIERGLGRRDAGVLLREHLERIYGLKPGAAAPFRVPGRFSWNPDMYWAGLSNHVATTARMFAHLSSLQEGEIKRYSRHAVNDARTCQLCAFLDGMVFEVDDGIAMRDEILKASSPEEYKKVAGWMRYAEVKSIFDKSGVRGLAETSACIVPSHFLCRCVIEAEFK